MKRLLLEYRFIAVGVGLAILYWITESFLEPFDSTHEGATYIERLFASGDPNELRMLLITIILLIAFGVYAQTLMKDVKRAEEKFQDTQQKYRTLVERMPAVVYIQEIGSPDSAMYMSPQIETLTGYSPEDCKDPDLRWRMVHPDDRQRLQSEEETGEPGEVVATEYRVVHRDGQTKWVRNESVLVEVSGTRYWQGFMLDITKRKEAERKQLEAETRYRTLVEHMPVIAFIVEPSCEENSTYPVVYISPQVEGVLGYEAQQFVDDPGLWNKLIHPEDLQEVMAENQRTDERGGTLRNGVPHDRPRRSLGVGARERGSRQGRGWPAALLARHQAGHYRAQAGRGGAEGERRTLPQHLRERPHRHGPRQPR
jgi:PAS domain S-box-containing protein